MYKFSLGSFGAYQFWRLCIYFWLKYSRIFALLSLYNTGVILTSKWPSRASRSPGLLFLTWDHIGEKKTSNDILSESTKQICSRKVMHTPKKGLYRCCIKNCEISNFGFLANFSVLFGRLTWEPMGNYNKCDIMETASRRAKLTKIWDSGISVTHMWGTFDLVVFKLILGSFGALVSKWPVYRNQLVQWNWVKFEIQGE